MATPKRPTEADKIMLINTLCDLGEFRKKLVAYHIINLSENSEATQLALIEQTLTRIVETFCKEACINYEQFLKEECSSDLYHFLKPGNFLVETVDRDQVKKAAWKDYHKGTGGLS